MAIIIFMEKVTKFQERFNECLQYAGVKQVDLARAANVSKQCVTDYKRGKSVPSIDTLYLICETADGGTSRLIFDPANTPLESAYTEREGTALPFCL